MNMLHKRFFVYLLILVSTVFFAMNYVFEWFKNIVFVMGVHYVLIAALDSGFALSVP